MMKSVKVPVLLCLLAVLLFCALFPSFVFADETVFYENEWGFVEDAMDITAGIPEDAGGRLGYIREKSLLRVATEPYFVPQEFIDPSLSGQAQYVGADMELARLIAERMGVELEIVPMDFTQVLSSVAENTCDLAISALTFTTGRAAKAEFSKAYHYSGESAGSTLIIRKENRNRIRSLSDLKDKALAAQRGSLQESLLAERVFNYREFRRVLQVQDIYEALAAREVDVGCVDQMSAQIYLDNNPKCGLMLVPNVVFVMEEQYDGDRIAARKGETELIAFVNGVINEVLDSGEYERWFFEYEKLAETLGY